MNGKLYECVDVDDDGPILVEVDEIKLLKQENEALKVKNESIIKANHSLIDTQARLQAECGKLESKSLCDDETISKLEAENERLKRGVIILTAAFSDWPARVSDRDEVIVNDLINDNERK